LPTKDLDHPNTANMPPTAPLLPSDVTLAILAGGESSRMGTPKSHLTLAGQPILQYLLHRFAWPGPTVLVTAPGREHPPGHDAFAREVVDPVAGQGPLRGILTALDASAGPVVVATVDMPGLEAAHLHWLLDRLAERPALAGIMLRRDGRVEPFPAAYRASAVDVVRSRLAAGRLSVHGLLEEPGFAAVDAPSDWPAEAWANLNRPEDVEAFRRLC
jgi:molybdopterin-guanine dinucleotide biosynthesis protein A